MYVEFCLKQPDPFHPLEPQSLVGYFDELERKRISQGSYNMKNSGIRHFIKWSIDKGLSDETSLRFLPERILERHDSEVLNKEQINTLITHANNPRDKALILLLLGTGAGSSEVLDLNVGDISRLPDGKTVISYKRGTKRRQPRKIEVNNTIADAVFGYIENEQIKYEDPLFQPNNRLRQLKHGHRRMTRAGLDVILKDYVSRMKIPNLNTSILKNTFISNFIDSIIELRSILGQTYFPVKLI